MQRAAVHAARSLPSNVLEVAAPVVLQNYEVYREMIGDAELPPLDNPVEVWQIVEPVSIDVPAHHAVIVPTFLLMAECSWQQGEPGIKIRA